MKKALVLLFLSLFSSLAFASNHIPFNGTNHIDASQYLYQAPYEGGVWRQLSSAYFTIGMKNLNITNQYMLISNDALFQAVDGWNWFLLLTPGMTVNSNHSVYSGKERLLAKDFLYQTNDSWNWYKVPMPGITPASTIIDTAGTANIPGTTYNSPDGWTWYNGTTLISGVTPIYGGTSIGNGASIGNGTSLGSGTCCLEAVSGSSNYYFNGYYHIFDSGHIHQSTDQASWLYVSAASMTSSATFQASYSADNHYMIAVPNKLYRSPDGWNWYDLAMPGITPWGAAALPACAGTPASCGLPGACADCTALATETDSENNIFFGGTCTEGYCQNGSCSTRSYADFCEGIQAAQFTLSGSTCVRVANAYCATTDSDNGNNKSIAGICRERYGDCSGGKCPFVISREDTCTSGLLLTEYYIGTRQSNPILEGGVVHYDTIYVCDSITIDCGDGASKNGYCTAGTCLSCTGTMRNCNGNAADACETNINTDVSNCGSCGTVCSSGVCTNGACVCGNSSSSCGSPGSCLPCVSPSSCINNVCTAPSACLGTNASCGTPGNCVACLSSQTCVGTSCLSNCLGTSASCGLPGSCVNCSSLNGVCSGASCVCGNSSSSCGAYPACGSCTATGYSCVSNSCVQTSCSGTASSCGVYPACGTCQTGQSCIDNVCRSPGALEIQSVTFLPDNLVESSPADARVSVKNNISSSIDFNLSARVLDIQNNPVAQVTIAPMNNRTIAGSELKDFTFTNIGLSSLTKEQNYWLEVKAIDPATGNVLSTKTAGFSYLAEAAQVPAPEIHPLLLLLVLGVISFILLKK
jgi:hypothetical protein